MCINDQKSNFRLLSDAEIYNDQHARALPPPHCTRKNQITQKLHSWTQRVKMTFLLILISLDCWFFLFGETLFWVLDCMLLSSAANAGMIGLPLEVSSSSPDNEDCVNERNLNMAHNFLLWDYLSLTLTRMQETWDATNWCNNMQCGGWPPWLLYQVFHIKLKTK